MTKYELSITKDYVPGWTLVDAMRELFQNALDQETVMPDNTMFWEYHEEVESFHIGNKLSILEPKTLLLGSSTKANDSRTIGKFGEGYKIATLVLTRLGKKVTFFNYGAREVWTARFSKSKKYDAEILVFEVDKKFPWAAVPNNNLTIVVEGITPEEESEIRESNLHMQKRYQYWSTPKGRILTDEKHKGKMFVNGLYICTSEGFHYGYDFKPQYMSLDRDRKLILDFDLKWTTSQMWVGFDDADERWDFDAIDAAERLISNGSKDVEYLTSFRNTGNKYQAVAQHTHDSFKHEHGDNAVPVTTTFELDMVPKTHKAIIVSEEYANVIKSSPTYIRPKLIEPETLREAIDKWVETYEADLPEYAADALYNIVEDHE
jgi:hypothetical protein